MQKKQVAHAGNNQLFLPNFVNYSKVEAKKSDIKRMQYLDKLKKDLKNKRILIVGEISALYCANHNGAGKNIPAASAALTALYVSSLGATVSLTGSVGADVVGSQIITRLKKHHVNIGGITIDPIKSTFCWEKIHKGNNENPINLTTQNQILDCALEQASNSHAILYICKNPAAYSARIYAKLKRVSEKQNIPFIIFSSLPLTSNPSKKNELFILHSKNGFEPSRKLCAKTKSSKCLVINKSSKFCVVNEEKVECFDHFYSKPIKLYQYEAALSALAASLLACNSYPEQLPKMAENMKLNNSRMSISSSSVTSSQ